MPFTDTAGNSTVHVRLEQLTDKGFRPLEGFRYEVPNRDDVYTVPKCQETDLASVPFFLAWFISSYGRHTLAAILHDYLWRERRADVTLRQANRVFRTALYELQIPFRPALADVDRRQSGGGDDEGPLWKARVIIWLIAILGLVGLTVWVVAKDSSSPTTIAALGCLTMVLVLLWPHIEIVGIGAPTVYLLIPAIALVLLTVVIYMGVERVAYVLGQTFRRPAHASLNPPVIEKSRRQRADSEATVPGI